jgi:hypothetical protein
MRHRGLFGVVAAGSLAAALLGCSRSAPDVKEPTPSPDPDQPPAQGAAPCDQEVALECPDGMSDGCSRQSEDGAPLTAYHVCVPAEEQAAGQPCEQEIARECGEGLTDACLLDPPVASSHLCVQATAGVAPEPSEPEPEPEPATEPAPEEPETPESQG